MLCNCYGCGFNKKCLFNPTNKIIKTKKRRKIYTILEIIEKCSVTKSFAMLILKHINKQARDADYEKFINFQKVENETRKLVPKIDTMKDVTWEDVTWDYIIFDIYLDNEIIKIQKNIEELILLL